LRFGLVDGHLGYIGKSVGGGHELSQDTSGSHLETDIIHVRQHTTGEVSVGLWVQPPEEHIDGEQEGDYGEGAALLDPPKDG
jgi:hypothetical protein